MFLWTIKTPKSLADLRERDALLESVMNLGGGLSIASQYPLVLAEDKTEFSMCLYRTENSSNSQELIAHMNYFPRNIVDQEGRVQGSLVMVANVATKTSYQGQGIMGEFINLVKTRARLEGHMAILLWSDQLSFYQKRGFEEVGKEYRICVPADQLRRVAMGSLASGLRDQGDLIVSETSKLDLTWEDLRLLLSHRYPVRYTIQRSLQEYQQLLKIPNTFMAHFGRDFKRGFALMNRGSDMNGVVHEWGALSPRDFQSLILKLADHKNLKEVMLLSPRDVTHEFLKNVCYEAQTEPNSLGLVWKAQPQKVHLWEEASGFFVWGMDSI